MSVAATIGTRFDRPRKPQSSGRRQELGQARARCIVTVIGRGHDRVLENSPTSEQELDALATAQVRRGRAGN
jgi:hypothetical protein